LVQIHQKENWSLSNLIHTSADSKHLKKKKKYEYSVADFFTYLKIKTNSAKLLQFKMPPNLNHHLVPFFQYFLFLMTWFLRLKINESPQRNQTKLEMESWPERNIFFFISQFYDFLKFNFNLTLFLCLTVDTYKQILSVVKFNDRFYCL